MYVYITITILKTNKLKTQLNMKTHVQKLQKITGVLFLLGLLSTVNAQAQNNVGIGTITPNPKAILDLKATDKGLLAPRMNTTQMNAIGVTATENALLVYNTDSNCYHFYNGTLWKNLCVAKATGADTAAINKAIKSYLSNRLLS